MTGILPVLEKAADECVAPRVAEKLKDGYKKLTEKNLDKNSRNVILKDLKQTVLNTAKRFGKGRFAQVASKHVHLAEAIPKYISNAIEWLIGDETD